MATLQIYVLHEEDCDYIKISQIIGVSFSFHIVILLKDGLEYHVNATRGDGNYDFAKKVLIGILEDGSQSRKFAVKSMGGSHFGFRNRVEESLDIVSSAIADS